MLQLPPKERVLLVAPLYHAAAALTALGALVAGSTAVIHEDFVPQAVVRALSEEGITRTTLVPAMIQACLRRGARRRAAPLRRAAPDRVRRVADRGRRAAPRDGGVRLRLRAGLRHDRDDGGAHVPLARRPPPRAARQAGAAALGGAPAAGHAHPRGAAPTAPTPRAGEVGEIVGRGAQLMRGYWNLPEASAEALRDGWMHTGDAGTLDAEGYLYLPDRVKDMIVSGGENVYPREVENVLFAHPAVADVGRDRRARPEVGRGREGDRRAAAGRGGHAPRRCSRTAAASSAATSARAPSTSWTRCRATRAARC